MAVVLSRHIAEELGKRQLRLEWIEVTARSPEAVRADPGDTTVRRHYRRIPEFGNRVLRVACRTNVDTIFVVSAFFDRNARRFV